MGIISRAADLYYTYKFIKTLVTPWDKMKAYDMGIIDANGKFLKKGQSLTADEKSEFTLFHRLVFNFKRILEKLPFGKTKLASYAAALFLLKEHTGMSEEQLSKALDEAGIDTDTFLPEETHWNIMEDGTLAPGVYVLEQDIASPTTGEEIFKSGSKVTVAEGTQATDHVFGEPIFKVHHVSTKSDIFVTSGDLRR